MRYLILSDIHGNLPALQAVLHTAQPFDAIWCLGDLVGYGPNPNECIERLQDFEHVSIVGNHDWGVLGRADPFVFNGDARQALIWIQGELYPENREYLAALPTIKEVGDFVLVHGSLREHIWEYLLDGEYARKNFLFRDFKYALVGHTHIPVTFAWDGERDVARVVVPDGETPLQLGDHRLIINPGSVGQPRDGDPRAAFGILDTETMRFSFHRAAYAVEITQERMRARGLPQRLIDRLEVGR
ncbi:MAG: metallophosphoesterase family protein [Anaerolineae bacterium]|nr:metallophosphoesterase family protein [Anaerolineae bacterium]